MSAEDDYFAHARQAARDAERAEEAVQWFVKSFTSISQEQRETERISSSGWTTRSIAASTHSKGGDMAMMGALEAYRQAARDAERAEEAVQWFVKSFPSLSQEQREEVRVIVLTTLYNAHMDEGRLPRRSPLG